MGLLKVWFFMIYLCNCTAGNLTGESGLPSKGYRNRPWSHSLVVLQPPQATPPYSLFQPPLRHHCVKCCLHAASISCQQWKLHFLSCLAELLSKIRVTDWVSSLKSILTSNNKVNMPPGSGQVSSTWNVPSGIQVIIFSGFRHQNTNTNHIFLFSDKVLSNNYINRRTDLGETGELCFLKKLAVWKIASGGGWALCFSAFAVSHDSGK